MFLSVCQDNVTDVSAFQAQVVDAKTSLEEVTSCGTRLLFRGPSMTVHALLHSVPLISLISSVS